MMLKESRFPRLLPCRIGLPPCILCLIRRASQKMRRASAKVMLASKYCGVIATQGRPRVNQLSGTTVTAVTTETGLLLGFVKSLVHLTFISVRTVLHNFPRKRIDVSLPSPSPTSKALAAFSIRIGTTTVFSYVTLSLMNSILIKS